MVQEVKILLYPEEHKSKNGPFFEKLMRDIFKKEGYEIESNVNFTGLEIDLWAKHIHRGEKLLIECKAKEKPLSTEIRNFCFNVEFKNADYGYFLYTEELDHQAAGLVDEIKQHANAKYKKLVFFGPDKIIKTLIDAGYIKSLESIDLPQNVVSYKKILAYTYFGIYYIIITLPDSGAKNYYVYNATTLHEIQDINSIANEEHSSTITIEQALKNGIAELKDYKHKTHKSVSIEDGFCPDLDETFIKYLEDTGVPFVHSQVDEIKLSDIFIELNLRRTSFEKSKKKGYEITKLWEVANNRTEDNEIRLIIIGYEISGKTSICKKLFQRYFNEGYYPILISGENIKHIRIDKFVSDVNKIFKTQYSNCKVESINKDKIILIIDDFHKFKAERKEDFRDVLIKNINTEFKNTIFIGSNLMPLEIMMKDKKIKNVFEKYEIYEILELGPKLRHQLVAKWISLGKDINYIDANELYKKYDEAERQIESIIGKNYIPAYPFYILTILQTLEGQINQKPNYSLHGFYYEHLINQKLYESVKNPDDISLYYNYITEFSFYLFENKTKAISIRDFQNFHKFYSHQYQISYSQEKILKDLQSAKLIEVNGSVSIPYKYVYYFFVAKYLTNNLSKPEIREKITKMCQRVHREEYANIIMFLTHLSKDPFIIKEILNNAKTQFSEVPIAKLEDDIKGINELVQKIPEQVIELVNTEDMREEELEEKEEIELLEKEYEQIRNDISDWDLDEDIDNINFIARMTLAFKTIEICGQLAKKYWGGMTGEEKYDIASETYFLGLRTLNKYLLFVQDNTDGAIDYVKGLIGRKHIKDKFISKQNLAEAASEFVFRLCFLATIGTVKRISHSIGYDKLIKTFESILETHPHPSIHLIDLAIHLDFLNNIPFSELKLLKDKLEGNHIGNLVLKNLMIDYMYMFNVDFKEKQKICSLLGIAIQEQRFFQNSSVIKKE